MIAIAISFLAGRYHATPWGRHINEGAVEWPPSPWRMLRALVATWKRTLPDLPQEKVEPILRALAGLPVFALPPASTGHTRHYMPWFKKGPDDRTLVFDTFVALTREAKLMACWPDGSLDSSQSGVLATILGNLNTLGRSESWCQATLEDAGRGLDILATSGLSCVPLNGGDVPPDREIVRLLCPDPASAFRCDAFASTSGTKCRRTAPLYDPDWHLCAETLWLHKERWSDPPGARWVRYLRPRDCFKIELDTRPGTGRRQQPPIQIARFVLDSTVLPLVTETLAVAEAARRRLMGIYGRRNPTPDGQKGRSPVFSGKDDPGKHLTGHGHAYYLPTDEDCDGRLDHLTVFARDGIGPAERNALNEIRGLATGRKGEESHPLRLLLLGTGTLAEFCPGPLGASRAWVSATPYVASLFAKTRGRNRTDLRCPEARTAFLVDDLREQIRDVLAGVPADKVQIEPIQDANGAFMVADRWRPIQFKRFRQKASDDGGRRLAGAFRLTFPVEMHGPIALGHSSHFGLGLFVPAGNRQPVQ